MPSYILGEKTVCFPLGKMRGSTKGEKRGGGRGEPGGHFPQPGKTNIIKVMAREKRKVSAIKTVRIKDFYSFKFHFYDSFFL